MTDDSPPTWIVTWRSLEAPIAERYGSIEIVAATEVEAMVGARNQLTANGKKVDILNATRLH